MNNICCNPNCIQVPIAFENLCLQHFAKRFNVKDMHTLINIHFRKVSGERLGLKWLENEENWIDLWK